MKSWPAVISGAIVFAVLASAISAWRWAVLQRRQNSPLLPYQPRAPVPWGAIDLIMMVLIAISIQILGVLVWQQLSGQPLEVISQQGGGEAPELSLTNLALFGASSLVTLVLVLAVVRSRTGAAWSELGVGPLTATDVQIALTGFALFSVPVFAIQFVLSQLWQESQHPIITLLQETPSPMFFVVSSFTAVLVAPLAEEFFFRVFLQGWLENMAALLKYRRNGDHVAAPVRAKLFLGCSVALEPGPLDDPVTTTQANWPSDVERRIDDVGQVELQPQWWPIVTSSALFALAHVGNGPDPVALFVFALGLGYIYQRTHRIWPCILVHMLLNGLSLSQLWLSTR